MRNLQKHLLQHYLSNNCEINARTKIIMLTTHKKHGMLSFEKENDDYAASIQCIQLRFH